jgi:hypothetical protein
MGDLSTFYNLPQSLSSEVYSFPCRGHSHLLLGSQFSIKWANGWFQSVWILRVLVNS